jgi:hypothetical protein
VDCTVRYVALHNNENDSRIVIGNCTKPDNDEDDEPHVSSKIKQNLTVTGEEEYDHVDSGFIEEGKIKVK